MVRSCNPVVFSFYNYLRTHPLIIRRHYGQPNGTPAGRTSERSSADEINLIERKLFFTTANAHFKVRLRGGTGAPQARWSDTLCGACALFTITITHVSCTLP